jgi:hypothetical protein
MQYPSLIKLASFTAAILVFCTLTPYLAGQASDAQASEPQTWTKTSESQTANMNPTRTTESHHKSGNQTVDNQTVERLGADGHYEAFYDVERESVQVNGTTTRTIERTFARDASGQRILTHVTQEEKQTLPAGGEKITRTTSNADLNGRLQIVQREVTDTKKISPELQEKNTTVFLSDGQGGMAPSVQIQQREKRSADHTVEVQTSTLLPDGNGKWQVNERKESTIKEDGKNRTTDEQVSREDINGKLTPSSRTLSKESETATGEKKNVIETYSTDVTGSAPEGNLRLDQRVTVVKRAGSDGAEKTEKRVEQRNLVQPDSGIQVTSQTVDTVKPGSSGIGEATKIEARDVNGSLTVVSFDTQKADNVHAINVDIATPNKAK